jgi:hypothetical protein
MIRKYYLQVNGTKIIQLIPLTNLYMELEGTLLYMQPRVTQVSFLKFWKKKVQTYPKPRDYWWSEILDSFFYVDDEGGLRQITKDTKPNVRIFIK